MAQIKVLSLAADGVPLEHSAAADDVTFLSFTVNGGGPVLSGSGLDMQNTDIVDVQDIAFTAPSTATINQTAGNLVIDNIMAKERSNTLTTAADILFPAITDVAGEVDAFRLPVVDTASATPTASGEGFLVASSDSNNLQLYIGGAWRDLSTVASANSLDNVYTADEAIAANDVVYISAADNVSKASAAAAGTAQAIGFATAAAIDTADVTVRSEGILSGFSGLTAGARYYLSATAGLVTPTIPVASGNTVLQCGYAKSATAMHIQFQSLGRRA